MKKEQMEEALLADISKLHDEWSSEAYISSKSLEAISLIIKRHISKWIDTENGILQAKVYAYETIIANSNFAPIIKGKEKKVKNNENN